MHIKILQLITRLAHAVCKDLRLIPYVQELKQAGNSTLLVPVFWYFYAFIWCILFADLPSYGSLNFAPDFLFLTHLAGLCISFLHIKTFILML